MHNHGNAKSHTFSYFSSSKKSDGNKGGAKLRGGGVLDIPFAMFMKKARVTMTSLVNHFRSVFAVVYGPHMHFVRTLP